jgi:hypothetical protein
MINYPMARMWSARDLSRVLGGLRSRALQLALRGLPFPFATMHNPPRSLALSPIWPSLLEPAMHGQMREWPARTCCLLRGKARHLRGAVFEVARPSSLVLSFASSKGNESSTLFCYKRHAVALLIPIPMVYHDMS